MWSHTTKCVYVRPSPPAYNSSKLNLYMWYGQNRPPGFCTKMGQAFSRKLASVWWASPSFTGPFSTPHQRETNTTHQWAKQPMGTPPFSLCVNVRIADCSFALAAPLYTQPKEKPCQHQKPERAETFRFVFTAQLLSFMWLQTDTAIPHFWLAKLKGINKW